MNVITAPDQSVWNRSIFLAGSIENGAAEQWQKRFIEDFQKVQSSSLNDRTVIYNPRRDEWDPNATSDDVRTQIRWEHKAMEKADVIAMYFDPATKSPITLQEQGMYAASGKLVVFCTPKFWRYDSVSALCDINKTRPFGGWDAFLRAVQLKLWPMPGL